MSGCPIPAKDIGDIARGLRDRLMPFGRMLAVNYRYVDCINRVKLFLLLYSRQTGDPMATAYANFTVDCTGTLCLLPKSFHEVLAFTIYLTASK